MSFVAGVLMPLVAYPLVWLGLTVTTCTMCDTDSIVTGAVLSTPLYLLAALLILVGSPSSAALVIAVLVSPILAAQAYYAIKISYVALYLRGCICGAYQPYPIESIDAPGLTASLVGPVLLATSVGLALLMIAKFSRHLRSPQDKPHVR